MSWKFEDARPLSEIERQKLSRMMYLAFCDLRALARQAQAQQAKDLAEAFHNVPLLMHTNEFSFKVFRELLERYQEKYKGHLRFDYLEEWEKLEDTEANV